MSQKNVLPIFPLEMVVFPEERVKLHIFEPRYKQLIGECRDSNRTFGIPGYFDGKLAECGTEMELLEISRTYADKRLDIIVRGMRVFRLVKHVKSIPGKLYAGAHVTFLENDGRYQPVQRTKLIQRFKEFHEVLDSGHIRTDFSAANLSFHLGHEVGLTLKQKVSLLDREREKDRLEFLLRHLKRMIATIQAAEETKGRIRRNGKYLRPEPLDF